MKYKIAGITHLDGKAREDGRYPLRIGSTVNMLNLEVRQCMVYEYITDANGNLKQGHLRTSLVSEHEFIEEDKLLIVTTCNSIYYLEQVE